MKHCGDLRQFKLRGTKEVSVLFGLHVIAYKLMLRESCSRRRWRRHYLKRWLPRGVAMLPRAGKPNGQKG